MAEPQPLRAFAGSEIDRAAEVLRGAETGSDESFSAYGVLGEWRAGHQIPVSRFEKLLIERGGLIDPDLTIASRLKRIPTMLRKHARLPHLRISKFQDIGGVRAILATPTDVDDLAAHLTDAAPDFVLKRTIDYVRSPKPSGYRSVHLVYEFVGREGDVPNVSGYQIEVQLRTRLQHAWATSNEVVGTFRREDLKSGEGHPDWLRFFTLAGSVVARKESTPPGTNVPMESAPFDAEFVALRDRLNVFDRISSYTVAQQMLQRPGTLADYRTRFSGRFFVLSSELRARRLSVSVFSEAEFLKAIERYRSAEQEHINDADYDTVFVTVNSLEDLKRAYPNYFADTRAFLDLVYEGALPGDAWPDAGPARSL